jgi:hypothetical protein
VCVVVNSQGAGSRAGYILDCKLKVERVWLGGWDGWREGSTGGRVAQAHEIGEALAPTWQAWNLGPCRDAISAPPPSQVRSRLSPPIARCSPRPGSGGGPSSVLQSPNPSQRGTTWGARGSNVLGPGHSKLPAITTSHLFEQDLPGTARMSIS